MLAHETALGNVIHSLPPGTCPESCEGFIDLPESREDLADSEQIN